MTMLFTLLALFSLAILIGQNVRQSRSARVLAASLLAIIQTALMLLYLLTMEAPQI